MFDDEKKAFFYIFLLNKFITMNIKKFIKACLHLLFCLLLVYWFYNNSFIRPYAIWHRYKEIICAVLLLSVIYLNYIVLVPKYVCKSSYKIYFLLSFLLLGVISIAELQLVKTDILRCVGLSINGTSEEIRKYLYNIQFILFLRNSGFYLFFTVLGLYEQSKKKALTEKKVVLKDSGLILLMLHRENHISLNIKLISYFSHYKNRTLVHFNSGKTTSCYSSLDNLQNYLEDFCLRISKSHIITFTNIVSYNTESVTVKCKVPNRTVVLNYYKKNAQHILQVLREKVPELEEKMINKLLKNEFGNIKKDENTKFGNVNNEILEEIKKNPGINALKLYDNLHYQTSISTMRRSLKKLTDLGFIKFKGSKKTGGYSVSNSLD